MLGSFTLFRCFLQPRLLSHQRLHAEVVAERRPGEGVDRGDSRGGGGGMSGERLARGRPAVVFRLRFLEEGEYARRLLLKGYVASCALIPNIVFNMQDSLSRVSPASSLECGSQEAFPAPSVVALLDSLSDVQGYKPREVRFVLFLL